MYGFFLNAGGFWYSRVTLKKMDEKFVICPFNKSHIVSRLRIQYHLVKCKRNYPNSKKIVCPYDATEYIEPDNFIQHLSQCKKNRRVDVTEGFKRKQLESIQHGCVNDQTFQVSPHVEITDEWDVSTDDSNDQDFYVMSSDERKALKMRQQCSKAVKRACEYIPLVPHPIGRGQNFEIYRDYLNRYKPSSGLSDSFTPILLNNDDGYNASDNDDNSKIYEDADDDNSDKPGVSDDNVNNILSVCHSTSDIVQKSLSEKYYKNITKYYMPPIARGRATLRSALGRGTTLGRGLNVNADNKLSSNETFDDVLKQVVESIMSMNAKRKENTSSLSDSTSSSTKSVANKLNSSKSNKFSLSSSDILIIKPVSNSSIGQENFKPLETSKLTKESKVTLLCDSAVNEKHESQLPASTQALSNNIDSNEGIVNGCVSDEIKNYSQCCTSDVSSQTKYGIGRGKLLESLGYH